MSTSSTDSDGAWTVADRHGIRHLFVARGGWREAYRQVIVDEGLEGVALDAGQGSLEFLEELPTLRRVSVIVDHARQLEPVTRLTAVEDLHIGLRSRSKAALDFSGLVRLRRLIVDGHPAFASLLAQPTLERLRIERTLDRDFSTMAPLPALSRLEIGPGRRLRSVAGVERFPALEMVGLYFQPNLRDISALAALPALQDLHIEGCKGIDALDGLAGIRPLRELSVSNGGSVASLAPLEGLTNLERFFATESTNVTDGDLSVLERLPKLREIGIMSRRHYDPSVDSVEATLAGRASGR